MPRPKMGTGAVEKAAKATEKTLSRKEKQLRDLEKEMGWERKPHKPAKG